MSPRDKELMDRYIYQVVRRLPKEQREEVGLELAELIGDMLEEEEAKGGATEEESAGTMGKVLTKLGSPAEFAKKYQDTSRYLIGPEYYDTWRWFLKIVMICTAAVVVFASIVEGMQLASWHKENWSYDGIYTLEVGNAWFFPRLLSVIGSVISACLGIFAVVTLVFAVLERRKVKLDILEEKQWSISDLGDNFTGKKKGWTPGNLAPIPHKKAMLKRSDCVAEIVFSILLGSLLLLTPEIFAIRHSENGVLTVVPMLNIEQWHLFTPWILLGLLFAIIDSCLCLAIGHYGKTVLVSKVVNGLISLLCMIAFFKMQSPWNPDMFRYLRQVFVDAPDVSRFLANWQGESLTNCILAIAVAISLVEIAVAAYKYLRYGVERQ